MRFSCYKGFKLVGERMAHCMGETWSMGELPVCVSKWCIVAVLWDEIFVYFQRQPVRRGAWLI